MTAAGLVMLVTDLMMAEKGTVMGVGGSEIDKSSARRAVDLVMTAVGWMLPVADSARIAIDAVAENRVAEGSEKAVGDGSLVVTVMCWAMAVTLMAAVVTNLPAAAGKFAASEMEWEALDLVAENRVAEGLEKVVGDRSLVVTMMCLAMAVSLMAEVVTVVGKFAAAEMEWVVVGLVEVN